MWDWHFHPPLGVGATLAVLAVVLCAAVWSYVRPAAAGLTTKWSSLLLVLRLAAIAVLGWVLSGPRFEVAAASRLGRVPVVFLVDTSRSMLGPHAEADRRDDRVGSVQPSRWETVRRLWLDPQFLSRLPQHGLDVRLMAFDDGVRALAPAQARLISRPAGERTGLFDAVAFAQAQLAAETERGGAAGFIVLLSDGHDTGGPAKEPRQTGPGSSCPVVTVCVGQDRREGDLSVSAWARSQRLLAGESTWIEAVVSRSGLDRHPVHVDLEHDRERIESRLAVFNGSRSEPVRFRVTPPVDGEPTSLHGYRVSARVGARDVVAVEPPEPDTDNNSRWVFLTVEHQPVRVVLFEGSPYWDTRFLARALRADPQIELTAVYATGNGRFLAVDAQSPTASSAVEPQPTGPWLDGFDVVVLGRGIERFFGAARAQLLVDFVTDRGGGLVLARGRAFDQATESGRVAQTIFSKVEPVTWGKGVVERGQLSVTPAGLSSPLLRLGLSDDTQGIVPGLAEMISATRIASEKSTSVVLLRQQARRSSAGVGFEDPLVREPMAALAHQRVGHGRVLAVLGDGLWRWSFSSANDQAFSSLFGRFWRRAIRWLATDGRFLPSEALSMSLSRSSAKPREPVTVTVAARGRLGAKASAKLTLTRPDGGLELLAMSRSGSLRSTFSATVVPAQPGIHRLSVAVEDGAGGPQHQASGRLAVYDLSAERFDTAAKPRLLRAISDATGGRVIAVEDRESLLAFASGLAEPWGQEVGTREGFDQPLALALIAGLLGFEWFCRGRYGRR